MSKSNYELYAEKEQANLLLKRIDLNMCIEKLKENAKSFSEEYCEAQLEFVAQMFDLSYEQVKRAVENQKYWY